MEKRQRAVELDFLRGIAILSMLFVHFSWDVRYEFGKSAFAYLSGKAYIVFFHPIVLVLFIGVSGICCTFSRNNIRRGLKMLAVASAFTIGSYIVQEITGIESLILFNVLHLLTVGIFIYSLVLFIERRLSISPELTNMLMGMSGLCIMMIGRYIKLFDHCTDNMLFLPIGFSIQGMPTMADYLPIFPWLGIFFVGAAIGRASYSDKKSKLPDRPEAVRKIASPIEFLGRHALVIYIVHQPIIYGLLALIFKVTGN